jgi:methionyl-tRNA formyltransferase
MPAKSIFNHCRGLMPWPGIWTELDGLRLHIWKCEPLKDMADDPGIVTVAHGDDLVVACGQSSLRILELQLEGRKRLATRQFLNGSRLHAGDVLGV